MKKCYNHHVPIEYEDFCVLCGHKPKRRLQGLFWTSVVFVVIALTFLYSYLLFFN